jgi:hypothetical protein
VYRDRLTVSVTVVQDYVPSLYLSSVPQPTHPYDAPLRFLVRTQSLPAGWSTSPDDTYEPWSAPNIVTGCGAAFFTEAVYTHIPARLLFVPSTQAQPHPSFQQLPEKLTHPQVLSNISDQEARLRLARTLDPLDARFAQHIIRLISFDVPMVSDSHSLLVFAAHALLATRSEPARVGDGSMYM